MNAKLDELLATCSEIKTLKNEICGLRGELKDLKDSLDFAHQEIETLKAEFAKTSATLEENIEDIESLDLDIETLKRRNINLEAYTRRENVRIFNVKEEVDENTEAVVRNLLVTKMQIPLEKVKSIRFERVHRIPKKTQNQRPPNRPRPVIARFSHYQDKEFVQSFYKNLKGSNIGFSDDFPKEVEDIHKALYPVLKMARQNQQRAYFNFDKLIIDGRIYRGKETKELPFYGNILKF
ncbi:protein unc-13 homolog C-like [Montipora capricornis]|uniref:protein unc-13 homolog C-like n=1 Tax=Montipora capricornis TaxID=246305 RepID=UPI0035F15316